MSKSVFKVYRKDSKPSGGSILVELTDAYYSMREAKAVVDKVLSDSGKTTMTLVIAKTINTYSQKVVTTVELTVEGSNDE